MKHPSLIRIATRGSTLALHQAGLVEAALAARRVKCEIIPYTTLGDRELDRPLSAIGAKGVFTQELEDDLRAGKVDCCVHSLKDLPTDSPPGLAVVAQLPREDPRDALIVYPGFWGKTVEDLMPRATLGTSSVRRRAQARRLNRDVVFVELRGNVPTRVRKVDEREVDAVILAAAGLHRLGLRERIAGYLEPPNWLPAAGQGAIAVQARADDPSVVKLLSALDHARTTLATTAERAFLAGLGGGCQAPIGALAIGGTRGGLTLHGSIIDIDERRVIRGVQLVGDDPEAAGAVLAEELLARGGDAVLLASEHASQVTAPQPE